MVKNTTNLEEYNSVWDSISNDLARQVKEESYNEFFADIKGVKFFENGFAYIEVKDGFIRDRINRMFLNGINEKVDTFSSSLFKFKFLTSEEVEEALSIIPSDNKGNDTVKNDLSINPNNNFENFVVDDVNRSSYLFAVKVADQPGVLANPLYISGNVGLGKTHLMQAIGNYILDQDVNKKVKYIKTESFIDHYVSCSSKADYSSFNAAYNDLDCLLIDDIQMIAKATESQKAFFKIFDSLSTSNKQIIITSDSKPSELNNIMVRLQSRFESGLVTVLKEPKFETKKQIVYKRLKSEHNIHKNEVEEKAIDYIVKNSTRSIRQLISLINTFVFYTTCLDYPLTYANCKLALEDIVEGEVSFSNQNESLVDNIKEIVCEEFNISEKDLVSNSRKKSFVVPRHISMYLIKEYTSLTLQNIAAAFNRKDHSTVINAYENVCNNIKEDENYNKLVEKFINKLSLS